MDMRHSALLLVLLILTAGAAAACPASYVKSLGQENQDSDLGRKASQVADGYMTARLMHPESALGREVKPYLVGTAVFESDTTFRDGSRRFDLNNWSIDRLVNDALGPYSGVPGSPSARYAGGHSTERVYEHFNIHFRNALYDMEQENAPTVVVQGG